MVVNDAGTTTLTIDVGEGPHPGGEMGPHPGGEMGPPPYEGPVPPPHPVYSDHINEFIQPLYEGVDYNEADPSQSTWTLPEGAEVDMDNSTITVTADMVNADEWLPPEATDNGDGTYTINSWPIDDMVVNDAGTITLTIDVGEMRPHPGGEMGPPPSEGEHP
jgi:hypothetical protein